MRLPRPCGARYLRELPFPRALPTLEAVATSGIYSSMAKSLLMCSQTPLLPHGTIKAYELEVL